MVDPRFGHFVNHDFAELPHRRQRRCAAVEAHWLDERDPHTNPMGAKGIGELGIVGAAAAIANAVHHATGRAGARSADHPRQADLDRLITSA